MVWLQNPENTRGEEWGKGEEVVRDAYDGPEPFSNKSLALDWLKLITDQTFDSPEQWVQWWQKNHSNLILSADGRKLVGKGKWTGPGPLTRLVESDFRAWHRFWSDDGQPGSNLRPC
jgi:hypothetical protein